MAGSIRLYTINRPLDAYGEVDPAGALEFNPPKDSDELFEALKESFPRIKTHKQRLQKAVIDFHLEEQTRFASDAMAQAFDSPIYPASDFTMNSWYETAAMVPTPSQDSTQSSRNCLPSPASSRHVAFPSNPATEPKTDKLSAVPNSMDVPGLKEMTNVWSVSTSDQPKIRTRRTMTDAEKKEYRKKRISGACTDCRRRRRKCDHLGSDSADSDDSPRVKKARKPSRIARSPMPTPLTNTTPFLEQSSTATTPSLPSDPSPQVMMADWTDSPSSALWPSSTGQFDFTDLSMYNDMLNDDTAWAVNDGFELLEPQYDPIFDLVDFDGGHRPKQNHLGFANMHTPSIGTASSTSSASQHSSPQLGIIRDRGSQHATSKDVATGTHEKHASPQLHQSATSSGILPLPSYYADTAQHQLSWNGGICRSPAQEASIPFILTDSRATIPTCGPHTGLANLGTASAEPGGPWFIEALHCPIGLPLHTSAFATKKEWQRHVRAHHSGMSFILSALQDCHDCGSSWDTSHQKEAAKNNGLTGGMASHRGSLRPYISSHEAGGHLTTSTNIQLSKSSYRSGTDTSLSVIHSTNFGTGLPCSSSYLSSVGSDMLTTRTGLELTERHHSAYVGGLTSSSTKQNHTLQASERHNKGLIRSIIETSSIDMYLHMLTSLILVALWLLVPSDMTSIANAKSGQQGRNVLLPETSTVFAAPMSISGAHLLAAALVTGTLSKTLINQIPNSEVKTRKARLLRLYSSAS